MCHLASVCSCWNKWLNVEDKYDRQCKYIPSFTSTVSRHYSTILMWIHDYPNAVIFELCDWISLLGPWFHTALNGKITIRVVRILDKSHTRYISILSHHVSLHFFVIPECRMFIIGEWCEIVVNVKNIHLWKNGNIVSVTFHQCGGYQCVVRVGDFQLWKYDVVPIFNKSIRVYLNSQVLCSFT